MKRKKRGFTLIELVVVISIIVIFAGFLIPKFAGYQTRAKDTKAINTAKQIQSAALSSYSEMDGKFVKTSVETAVAELTGAEAVTAIAETDSTVKVSFTSDTVSYTVDITDSSGTFTVLKGEDQIYPKQ
ncbi:MAG TPA: type II secretion system protein [Clostridiaceae bacterium]|nr:type II secretion system protein [Clostridiaceae bacterium]